MIAALTWLTARRLGLARAQWIALALLAAVIAFAFLGAREAADDKRNQTIGAIAERERTATATIEQGVKANAAAEQIRRDPAAANAECLRNARNVADC